MKIDFDYNYEYTRCYSHEQDFQLGLRQRGPVLPLQLKLILTTPKKLPMTSSTPVSALLSVGCNELRVRGTRIHEKLQH